MGSQVGLLRVCQLRSLCQCRVTGIGRDQIRYHVVIGPWEHAEHACSGEPGTFGSRPGLILPMNQGADAISHTCPDRVRTADTGLPTPVH